MSAASLTTRLVTGAARQVLAPMGLRQKGRSRTWIDDRAWWLIVVEFQPSSWTRGTYLNVGANWLWVAKSHLSFDYGYRVRWATNPIRVPDNAGHTTEFIDHHDDHQFGQDVGAVCQIAGQRVRQLRELLRDVRATARILSADTATDQGWPAYHAGIAAGLSGETATARSRLMQVAAAQPTAPWQEDLIRQARDLVELVDNQTAFEERITSTVAQARSALKLEPAGDLNLV